MKSHPRLTPLADAFKTAWREPTRLTRIARSLCGLAQAELDVQPYLARYRKEDATPFAYDLAPHAAGERWVGTCVSEGRMFSVGTARARGFSGLLHVETPYGILLRAPYALGEEPIEPAGVIGFTVGERGMLDILQLQAQRYVGDQQANPLRALRWERMLVQALLDWGAAAGFTSARIQPAERNPWNPGAPKKSETVEQFDRRRSVFKMRYDVTAERSGFERTPDGSWFERALN